MEKATDPSVLLAYEMNGEPLRPEHGFPLRVVVPGYVGARSVKWLSRVELREAPSDNRFQAREYRLFLPYLEEPEDPSLGDLPVNAVICVPEDGETLRAGPVSVRGYAIAGSERVDLSADEGETWSQADPAERLLSWGLAPVSSETGTSTRTTPDRYQGGELSRRHPARGPEERVEPQRLRQ